MFKSDLYTWTFPSLFALIEVPIEIVGVSYNTLCRHGTGTGAPRLGRGWAQVYPIVLQPHLVRSASNKEVWSIFVFFSILWSIQAIPSNFGFPHLLTKIKIPHKRQKYIVFDGITLFSKRCLSLNFVFWRINWNQFFTSACDLILFCFYFQYLV